jgi:phosphatidylglycerophosphatase A
MKKIVAFIATGLGFGYSPIASGTVGSLWGILIVYAMADLSLPAYVAVCIGLTLLAIPVCDVAEKHYGKKDDGRIVADEFLTFPIGFIGLTPYLSEYWWLMPMAFCCNRFFDILKLPPASQFERIPGGAGITLDDAAAAFYSLIANWIMFAIITTWLVGRVPFL